MPRRLRTALRVPPALRVRLRYASRPRARFVLIEDAPEADVGVGALRNPCLDYLDYMLEHHPQRFAAPGAVEEWRLTFEQPAADTQLECLSDLMDVKKRDRIAARALAQQQAPTGARKA